MTEHVAGTIAAWNTRSTPCRIQQPTGDAESVDMSHGWLIHKTGRGWYRPNAQGYTSCTCEAGRYSHEDALSYSHPNGWKGPRDDISIKHESEVAQPTQPAPKSEPLTGEQWAAAVNAMTHIFRRDMDVTRCPGVTTCKNALEAALIALKGGPHQ